MQCQWRMWAASVVVAAVVVAGVQGEEEWQWRHSRKASSIPGYVEPTTSTSTSTTTTTSPPVTTFRPAFSMEQQSRTLFRGASANPYFLMMVGTHRQPHDGTTKSRVVVDTPLDEDGPEPLVLGDTYTTVDRLQSARGAPPQLPRPQKHLLGGLHPDEVFYANDDLLITRGGGFHSEVFQEPSQLLHEDDSTKEDTLSKTSPIAGLPPSPDQEYNGNIPIILPPPTQTHTKPLSFLVGGASQNNYMLVPYVYPRAYTKVVRTYPSQITYRYRYYPSPAMLQAVAPLPLPHSLVGDTDVNFRHPRPPINPDAEVFVQHPNPTWRRANL